MLTLVSTPIGNLGDISQRALETLKTADLVISEDTRKTGFLLKHFDIRKPQLSFREDNEQRVLPKILELLRSGQNVALVTDAGTPSGAMRREGMMRRYPNRRPRPKPLTPRATARACRWPRRRRHPR